MRLYLLLLTLFLFPSLSYASYASAYDQTAKFLCSLVTAKPDFEYENYFQADDLASSTLYTKEVLVQIFSSLYSMHGQCTGVKLATSNDQPTDWKTYFLTLSDQTRAIFLFKLDSKLKKISGLDFSMPVLPETQYTRSEIQVSMQDGIKLRTFVYQKKDGPIKKPAVLLRTPYLYRYGQYDLVLYEGLADYILKQGYHLVVQAIRGTFGSQGTYHFMHRSEVDDGFNTVNWLNDQYFCDGNIAIMGTSYDGFTALAAGVRNPKALKVIFAGGAPSDAKQDGFFTSGFMSSSFLPYLNYIYTGHDIPFAGTSGVRSQLISSLLHNPDFRTYDQKIFGYPIPEWRAFTENAPDPNAAFWNERKIAGHIRDIAIPTYHIAGMRLDGDMPETVRNFIEADENPAVRSLHHLILGFWDHGNSTPYMVNGANLSPFMAERFEALLAYHLKGTATEYAREPRVQIVSNLSDRFKGGEHFPPGKTKSTALYFNQHDSSTTLDAWPQSDTPVTSIQYLPTQINEFTTLDQNALFNANIEKAMPIFGPLHFDLYFQTELPQADVFLIPYRISKEGTNEFVSDCMIATKVFGGPQSSHVSHVSFDSCPIITFLQPGDQFGFLVTTNVYPTIMRNTGNPDRNFWGPFHSGEVHLLHSAQYSSKVSIPIELNESE